MLGTITPVQRFHRDRSRVSRPAAGVRGADTARRRERKTSARRERGPGPWIYMLNQIQK